MGATQLKESSGQASMTIGDPYMFDKKSKQMAFAKDGSLKPRGASPFNSLLNASHSKRSRGKRKNSLHSKTAQVTLFSQVKSQNQQAKPSTRPSSVSKLKRSTLSNRSRSSSASM